MRSEGLASRSAGSSIVTCNSRREQARRREAAHLGTRDGGEDLVPFARIARQGRELVHQGGPDAVARESQEVQLRAEVLSLELL